MYSKNLIFLTIINIFESGTQGGVLTPGSLPSHS
jgi:hypothetical protein